MKVINKNTFIAALGGFQYGYNSTVIAGAILFLSADFSLTIWEQGFVVSILLLAAFCTSSFAGILGNYIGRRGALMLSAWLFLIGILLSTIATQFTSLLIGRVFVGLGAGIVTTIAPLYLAEIASAEKRGMIVNLNQIGISTGALAAYLSGYLFSSFGGWRMMFAIGMIPALIQAIGIFFIPETYTLKNAPPQNRGSWKILFRSEYKSRILLGAVLCALQQITGINAIFYYTPYILEDAGYSTVSGTLLSTVGIGVIYVISILISLWLVDKIGRRPLILWSLGGMIIHLMLLSCIFISGSPFFEKLTLFPLLCIVLFYAIGIGPVPQIMIAEMCPILIRGHALTFTGFIGWVCNFLITLTFLDLTLLISPAGTFFLYGILGLLGFFFLIRRIPETKQKTLEEIEKQF